MTNIIGKSGYEYVSTQEEITVELTRLNIENNQLITLLKDALLLLELKYGKEAQPKSIIYEIRKIINKNRPHF
jgi:hypothetical protein